MAAKKPEKGAAKKTAGAAKAAPAAAAKRGRAADAGKPAGTKKAAAGKPAGTGAKALPPERKERTRTPVATAKAVKTVAKTPSKSAPPAAATAAKKAAAKPAPAAARATESRPVATPAAAPPRRRPTRPARDIYSPATGTSSAEPITGKELEKFRQLIVDLRNESIEELEMLTEQLREMTASEVGDDNNAYSLHMAEQGTDAMEREKTFLQAQRTSDYVKKLGEALERIDNGTFGLCRLCGLRLDSKRLMAVPVTQVCTVYKNTSKPCEPGRLHMQELGINQEEPAGQ